MILQYFIFNMDAMAIGIALSLASLPVLTGRLISAHGASVGNATKVPLRPNGTLHRNTCVVRHDLRMPPDEASRWDAKCLGKRSPHGFSVGWDEGSLGDRRQESHGSIRAFPS